MRDNLTLRDFQQDAIWYLMQRKRGVLALPTGTGKTISAFSVYTYFKHKFPALKLIFVTEKPLIKQVMSQDLPTYFKDLKACCVYDNTKQERKAIYKDWIENKDILILNYASVRIDLEDLGEVLKPYKFFYMVIYDEATNFKNPEAQVSKAVSILVKASKRAYAMTATPSTGTLEDVYNILTTMGVNPYKNVSEFYQLHCKYDLQKMFYFQYGSAKKIQVGMPSKDKKAQICYASLRKIFNLKGAVSFMAKPSLGVFRVLNENNASFQWAIPNGVVSKSSIMISNAGKAMNINVKIFDSRNKSGYKNLELFSKTVSNNMFIRAKKDVAKELPPVVVGYRYVDESKEVNKVIKEMYASGKVSASKIEIALCFPQVYDCGLPYDYQSDKIKEIIHFLRESIPDEKVILYAPYTSVTSNLRTILNEEFNTKCAYVSGEGLTDTNKEIKRFLEDDDCRFLVGTDTMQKGLNIQQVNYIIPVVCPNTFGSYSQLVGRISRIGGSYTTKNIVHFITSLTRDEDKIESLLAQIKLIHRVNSKLVEQGLLPMSDKEIKEMDEKDSKQYLEKMLLERKEQYL